MTRGPKPTPRNLRLVKGSDKPSRMNADEPIVAVSIPDPPEYLSQDEQNVFSTQARLLAKMRVMSEADVDALAMYSRAHVEALMAHQKVVQMGYMVQAPKTKVPMHNPFLSIRNNAEKKARAILTEFGLTPSSRTRVNKS